MHTAIPDQLPKCPWLTVLAFVLWEIQQNPAMYRVSDAFAMSDFLVSCQSVQVHT